MSNPRILPSLTLARHLTKRIVNMATSQRTVNMATSQRTNVLACLGHFSRLPFEVRQMIWLRIKASSTFHIKIRGNSVLGMAIKQDLQLIEQRIHIFKHHFYLLEWDGFTAGQNYYEIVDVYNYHLATDGVRVAKMPLFSRYRRIGIRIGGSTMYSEDTILAVVTRRAIIRHLAEHIASLHGPKPELIVFDALSCPINLPRFSNAPPSHNLPQAQDRDALLDKLSEESMSILHPDCMMITLLSAARRLFRCVPCFVEMPTTTRHSLQGHDADKAWKQRDKHARLVADIWLDVEPQAPAANDMRRLRHTEWRDGYAHRYLQDVYKYAPEADRALFTSWLKARWLYHQRQAEVGHGRYPPRTLDGQATRLFLVTEIQREWEVTEEGLGNVGFQDGQFVYKSTPRHGDKPPTYQWTPF